MARNFTISLPAASFNQTRGALTGASLTTQAVTNSHRVAWAFDDAGVEGAAGDPFACPTEYTGSGTLKAKVFFASATQNSGTAVFGINVEAITAGTDTLNVATTDNFDSANLGSTNLSGSTVGDLLAQEITLTNKDGVAAGDQVRVAFYRNTPSDSVSDDLYVYLVEIYEET